MELAWSTLWTPADPIEVMIDRLEDCFVLAKHSGIAYTFTQMIDKALTAVQVTGLFPTAILEWNGFASEDKTWPEFKSHFIKTYELWMLSGVAGIGHSYQGSANAQEIDDNSVVTTITKSVQEM